MKQETPVVKSQEVYEVCIDEKATDRWQSPSAADNNTDNRYHHIAIYNIDPHNEDMGFLNMLGLLR